MGIFISKELCAKLEFESAIGSHLYHLNLDIVKVKWQRF